MASLRSISYDYTLGETQYFFYASLVLISKLGKLQVNVEDAKVKGVKWSIVKHLKSLLPVFLPTLRLGYLEPLLLSEEEIGSLEASGS